MAIGLRHKHVETSDRIVLTGKADLERCDNSIRTSKYTILSFLPIALREQFRRVANMYFLIIGCIMAIGYYTPAFDSAISPWTTLGPLAFVLTISLIQEGIADIARHKSDMETNNYPCVVLRRADELDEEGGTRDPTVMGGNDLNVSLKNAYFQASGGPNTPSNANASIGENFCKIAYESVMRRDIRTGHFVLVRNRDMVPADMILLASSSDNGNAYIETSSIDGETNLKLRTSPRLPKSVIKKSRSESMKAIIEERKEDDHVFAETLEQATKRLARYSYLAYPDGTNAVENPANPIVEDDDSEDEQPTSRLSVKNLIRKIDDGVGNMRENIEKRRSVRRTSGSITGGAIRYVGALTSEPPNASVNTYTGKLTLPPVEIGGPSIDIPLGAENVLLRGALLRNTEWAIGLAFFTGTDTKLVQNSFDTPSKFSRLDKLMNLTVKLILCVMFIVIATLAGLATRTNSETVINLWYAGFNRNASDPWPYLPEEFNDTPPEWETSTPNYAQLFFLYVTLLSNFIPLSLYVTVELVTFTMIFLINLDKDIYHEKTDTRAVARSTNVTDLGQVQYIFSDKTGTLTQNVMRFKRCSVDGMVFGAPIEKAKPDAAAAGSHDEEDDERPPFHPLRRLLVGRIKMSPPGKIAKQPSDGLEGLGEVGNPGVEANEESSDKLTFNAEMFLRVMAICHTVVVEKEFGENIEEGGGSVSSQSSGWSSSIAKNAKKLFNRSRAASDLSGPSLGTPLAVVSEKETGDNGFGRDRSYTNDSAFIVGEDGPDGAPAGFQYQAESPDEGALVSAASSNFGFQVIGRDSSGVQLAVSSPSLLEDSEICEGLTSGKMTPKSLAVETAELPSAEPEGMLHSSITPNRVRRETWAVLAINKFDSDRKRMSVLVRSPPELGSIPMLLCKGADSSMLDPEVSPESSHILMTGDETPEEVLHKAIEGSASSLEAFEAALPSVGEDEATAEASVAQEEWLMSTVLGIQEHLGEFAREGLRTLVLGLKLLTEKECNEWLATYKAAATALKKRDEKLQDAAKEIERGLHIVGATAIEDKLQRGVPETISILEKAGIKLWVLTGDKRETAIEIGYSTHVLTSKMHVTEVADGPPDHVRTQMAMEFIRLVKMGKLKDYQKAVLAEAESHRTNADRMFYIGRNWRRFLRAIKKFFLLCLSPCMSSAKSKLEKMAETAEKENNELSPSKRRRAVRECADKQIQDYLSSPAGLAERKRRRQHGMDDDHDELSLASDDLPGVFNRASSARQMLNLQRSQGKLTGNDERALSLAQVTGEELGMTDRPLVDEDVLSLQSYFPNEKNDTRLIFDRKKRTVLERVFAVDSDVRHGRLRKHLKKENIRRDARQVVGVATLQPDSEEPHEHPTDHVSPARYSERSGAKEDRPRALVIEGHALLHLLGDPLLEEILFGVASSCNAVIACRVSPKQKALIVKLVRHNVTPEPVTLAIGDGANDVGMIQEAHVGVGVSGLEGKQAVNASDFAIAQFRYLEELLLIHGRWNFFRQSTVVMFSFYKNACMSGIVVLYSGRTLFSGTPLFDEWVLAVLNFVAAVPILFLGMFDRCLEKDYVRAHPEVYAPGRNNELITLRTIFRWLILTFVHIFTLYYLSVPAQVDGSGITPAFSGLMGNKDRDLPGDGEGSDLKSVGTVTYTNLIVLLALKVLYESKSLLHGKFPAFWCRNKNEGFFDRLAYTWVGVTWGSLLFYLFFLYVYQVLGRGGASIFSAFVDTTNHILHYRSINYMVFILVPTAGICLDVTGKLFSNVFYPTQTQIHLEVSAIERKKARRRSRQAETVQQHSAYVDESDYEEHEVKGSSSFEHDEEDHIEYLDGLEGMHESYEHDEEEHVEYIDDSEGMHESYEHGEEEHVEYVDDSEGMHGDYKDEEGEEVVENVNH